MTIWSLVMAATILAVTTVAELTNEEDENQTIEEDMSSID